jgi:hypothetical protein
MLPDLESRCNMGVSSVISCSFDPAIDAGVLASRMNVEKCLLLNTLRGLEFNLLPSECSTFEHIRSQQCLTLI